MEYWKQVVGTRYLVSINGEVSNMDTQRILELNEDQNGYITVNLYDPEKRTVRVHRLVAEVFVANPDNKPVVNHLNGIKSDNRYTNLVWATSTENLQHAYDTGLKSKGSELSWSKLTESDVEQIKLMFIAGNRSCDIARQFGIAEGSVSNIKKGRAWKHVRPDLVWAEGARLKSTRKLSAEDIPSIRQNFADGLSDADIAAEYGVNRGTIWQIRAGKNWTNY